MEMVHQTLLFIVVSAIGVVPALRGQQEEKDPGHLLNHHKAIEERQRNLTIEDLFRLKRVQGPQINPEEKWLASTVEAADLKEDKWEKQVWIVPTAGGGGVGKIRSHLQTPGRLGAAGGAVFLNRRRKGSASLALACR